VLWLIKGLGAGGAEHLLCSLARAFPEGTATVEAAYVLAWKDALVADLSDAGVTVRPLGVMRFTDIRWVARLWSLLRRGNFDVVHTHSPAVASVVRLVALGLPRRRRPALVTTEHSQWSGHPAPTRWANRATFGRDRAHLAVAAMVRASLPEHLRSRVEVVRQGVDAAALAARAAGHESVRAELGVADDEVLVVTVANLRRHKGYPDLLAAAAALPDHATAIRIVAAGQGPLAAEMAAEAERLGLGDRFRFLGYRTDVPRLVAAADLFVLASVVEGLPIALVEALALATPVVATAVGEVPSVVDDGVHGLLVPPGRPDRLAAALAELAADPERRRAMAGAAAVRGAELDIGAAALHHAELYRRLAAARR
jgi:glycosyltransferase involved in cell wall biosynthesis